MNQPSVDDDELLVAYLDGELPRIERTELEQRLVNDETLRIRLQSLQRGWDLLDMLPAPSTTEHDVQSTLELVVADISGSTIAGFSPVSKTRAAVSASRTADTDGMQTVAAAPRRRWSWIAIPVIAIAVAFLGVRWFHYRSETTQAMDFPVALYMEAYAMAGNSTLIDDLMKSPRWRSVVSTSIIPDVDALVAADSEESLYRLGAPTPSMPELTSALTQLPDDQRLLALAKWERFDQLEGLAKEQLRSAAKILRDSPDHNERLQTMRDYARWREQLSDATVAGIEENQGEERQTAIEIAIAETVASIGQSTGRNLSEEAIERIDFTLIQIAKRRFPGADGNGDPDLRKLIGDRVGRFMEFRGKNPSDPNIAFRMIARAIVFQDKSRAVAPLDSTELELIYSMLPTKDAEELQPYVSEPWMRSMILQDWAQESLRRKLRGRIKTPTLAERYESLPSSQREVIDLMPPETSRRWLLDSSP